MIVRKTSLERECYSLRGFESQPKKALRIGGSCLAEADRIFTSSIGELDDGVRYPGRLIALAAKRDWRQVRRVGFHQQTVARNEPQQRIIRPLLEGDDSAERHVPPGVDRKLGEARTSRVAMQYATHIGCSRFTNYRARVLLGVASVNDEGLSSLSGKLDLRRERLTLCCGRRIIVVIVEATLANGDRLAQKCS